jgi:hypothetical protein
MNKAAEYRTHAAAAVKLATGALDPDDKALMLKIAQGWLDLAQRAEAVKGFLRFRSSPRVARRSDHQRPAP